jgi:hypothetical protein
VSVLPAQLLARTVFGFMLAEKSLLRVSISVQISSPVALQSNPGRLAGQELLKTNVWDCMDPSEMLDGSGILISSGFCVP